MLIPSCRALDADFLTGVYHWSVDNYGSGATPIVGSQIAAFQGHHQRPWTITEREFCNNVHKVGLREAPEWLPFACRCSGLSMSSGLDAHWQRGHLHAEHLLHNPSVCNWSCRRRRLWRCAWR